MRIVVGSDHCGFTLKKVILPILKKQYEVIDCGCHSTEPVDFPDVAKEVCEKILTKQADRGIMFCGTGVGAAIACNKIKGIRASVCHDVYTAHQCVEHDDVQVITMGNQVIGSSVAEELIQIFLEAEFSTSEEFRRRVEKLNQMDNDL
jgi:ribose 5-phosphate isomerase B